MRGVIKDIFAMCMAKINKTNRLYLIGGGWFTWLIVVDWILFGGTYINYLFFFGGLILALAAADYVTEHPNEKEQKTLNLLDEIFESEN